MSFVLLDSETNRRLPGRDFPVDGDRAQQMVRDYHRRTDRAAKLIRVFGSPVETEVVVGEFEDGSDRVAVVERFAEELSAS